ncbi:hypothetical protein [Amycolatopsis sp. WGS_07]|uniref:hypothetical protein n=1 Tax=Amycolatopsis sp. WGS_07 TaxID=3076764 RepID=UPI003872EC7B
MADDKKQPTAESVSDPSSTDYDPRNKDLYNPTLDPSSKYYIGPVRPDDVASGDKLREDATTKIDSIFNGWLLPNVQGKARDQLIQAMYQRNLEESKKNLGKDLEMRDPGAAPHTDWKNATHEQMVEAITSDADPAAVAESSEEWVRIGNELATHQKNLGDAINASTSDWKGEGGDAARVHLANVGKWLGTTAQGASLTGRQQEIHSQALNETQKAMNANPPVKFSAQDANKVLMTIKDPAAYVVAYSSAMKTFNDQQAARDQAAQIMTRYDQTIGGAVATPKFAEPPKLPTARYSATQQGTPLGGGGAGAPGGLRVGPDGRPIGPDGKPIGPPGTTLGPNGQPIGPDGRPLGPDGKPIGPPGTTVGPDGQPIGPDGKPLGGPGGGGYGGGNGGPGGQNPDRRFDPASLKIPEGGPGGGPGGGGPGGSFPTVPGSDSDPGSTKAQGFTPPNIPPIPGGGNPGGGNPGFNPRTSRRSPVAATPAAATRASTRRRSPRRRSRTGTRSSRTRTSRSRSSPRSPRVPAGSSRTSRSRSTPARSARTASRCSQAAAPGRAGRSSAASARSAASTARASAAGSAAAVRAASAVPRAAPAGARSAARAVPARPRKASPGAADRAPAARAARARPALPAWERWAAARAARARRTRNTRSRASSSRTIRRSSRRTRSSPRR